MQNILHLTAFASPRDRRPGGRLLILLALWRHRVRVRHELARMDDRALRDMGVGRTEQWAECGKPFWRE